MGLYNMLNLRENIGTQIQQIRADFKIKFSKWLITIRQYLAVRFIIQNAHGSFVLK